MNSDLRFALRSVRRAPAFFAVAFVTLVAGIASVTTIFSYMNAIYYAPLPYKDADRIVSIGQRIGYSNPESNAATVQLVREATRSFERIVVFKSSARILPLGDAPRSVRTLQVDTSFFPQFALRPQLGRLLAPDDIRNDASVVVISDALWRSAFGADSNVIGRRIESAGFPAHAVIGVLPPDFRYPYQTDLISPLRESAADRLVVDEHDFSIIAKLKPGVTRNTARAEVSALATRLPKELSGAGRIMMTDEMLERRAQNFLPLPWLFLGTGILVLMIACANVANLFLARAADRAREMAVRASLGATRVRLIRQTLVETLVLGSAAAVAGTYVAHLMVKVFLALIPTHGFPSWFRVTVDNRVIAFAAGASVLVALAVGLTPALEGTKFDLARALKVGGDSGATNSAVVTSSKRGLAMQLALAVALFGCSALLVRSYLKLTTVDFGFPADKIATVTAYFDQVRYKDIGQRIRFLEQVASQAVGAGGVTATAVKGHFGQLRSELNKKLTDREMFDQRLVPDGDTTRVVPPIDIRAQFTVVGDNYFEMLGLALRTGRRFAPSDVQGSEEVAVVSEALAKLHWPKESAIGHTIQLGTRAPLRIVGVVQDTYELSRGREGVSNPATPTLYLSLRQAVTWGPEIIAIGKGDVLTVRDAVVQAIRRADANLIVGRNTTMASSLDEMFLVTRVFGGIIAVFSIMALALAMIGTYGVVAFGVTRRTREIGIRMALGGTRAQILRLIMGDASIFIAIGGIIGIGLAVLLGQVLRRFLFGVSAVDPIAYVFVCLVFSFVAVVASYLPARRATKVDPLVALRAE